MIKLSTLLIVITVLFSSCEKESLPPSLDTDAGINLRDLKIGDKASYLLYTSQCEDNFQFSGDTLNVEVIDKNDSFYLRESYTNGSFRDRTTEHLIVPKDGYVLIPERFNSEFLFFYGNDSIFLDRPPNTTLVQSGCRLLEDGNPFIGEAIGTVDEFNFGSLRIQDKKGISCVPGFIINLEAYIFYSDRLTAVHIIENDLGSEVLGFVAID